MMESQTHSIQLYSARFFKNLTMKPEIIKERMESEDLDFLVGKKKYILIDLLDRIDFNKSKDVKVVLLESIVNLTDIHESISDLCKNGLIKLLNQIIENNPDMDLVRNSLEIIDKITKIPTLQEVLQK